jgi:FtsZ-binding cell division protein ZapB
MITLEQITLLEAKIAKAIDLIRVLKEENSTLRKGLESAQRRMKELESMVEDLKSDQKEIESVVLRTLANLDELEEASDVVPSRSPQRGGTVPPDDSQTAPRPQAAQGSPGPREKSRPSAHGSSGAAATGSEIPAQDSRGELDIF